MKHSLGTTIEQPQVSRIRCGRDKLWICRNVSVGSGRTMHGPSAYIPITLQQVCSSLLGTGKAVSLRPGIYTRHKFLPGTGLSDSILVVVV